MKILTKKWFKGVCVLTAGVFLWDQVLWAGDYSINAVMDRQYVEQSNKYAPNYVQSANAIQANVVSTQQAIEDFNAALQGASSNTGMAEEGLPIKGPIPMPVIDDTTMQKILEQIKKIEASMNKGDGEDRDLIVTTAAGDKVYYKGSDIDHVVMVDGTVIRNIVTDTETGAFLGCQVEYTDGTEVLMADGKVTTVTEPDGTEVRYIDEKVNTITDKDGNLLETYDYCEVDVNNDSVVKVIGGGKTVRYNKNNRLMRVIYDSGKTINYDDGILTDMKDTDGTIYRYGRTVGGTVDNPEYTAVLKEIMMPDTTVYYINNNTITEIHLPDGRYFTDFTLDGQYRLVSGLITCATEGVYTVIKDHYKIEEVDQYHIRTMYEYVDKIVPNKYNSIITADMNGDGKKEKIIDFGAVYGTWVQYTDGSWVKLHDLSPFNIIPVDLNSNGKDDLIVDFGTEYGGVWIWYDNTRWEQLHTLSPVSIVTTRLNSSGEKGLVVDFGAQYGVWLWSGTGNWYQINPVTARQIVSCDIDGDKVDELVIDFGPQYGIYTWKNKVWTSMNSASAVSITPITLTTAGKKGLVIDFGPQYGILLWSGPGNWYQVNRATAKQIVSCDIDGDKVDELVIDFGPQYGILIWDNKVFRQLHASSAKQITTGDIDGNGKADIVIDFGDGSGIWTRMNNSYWAKLHEATSCSLQLTDLNSDGKDEELIDFGGASGIWANYGTVSSKGWQVNWQQVHTISPGSITDIKDDNGNWQIYMRMIKAWAWPYSAQFTLPGAMFKSDGTLAPAYDYTDIPYYNTYIYDKNMNVKKIIRPDGVEINNNNGLLDDITRSGVQLEKYEFDKSLLGNITDVITRKSGIGMSYDPVTGNILSLHGENMNILFNQDGTMRYRLDDGPYLDASKLTIKDGSAQDGAFDEYDENNVLITHTEYKNGTVSLYRDRSGNEYRYDDNGALIEFRKNQGADSYVSYAYTKSTVPPAKVSRTESGLETAEWIIGEAAASDLSKLTSQDTRRVIYRCISDGTKKPYYVERGNGDTLTYDYGEVTKVIEDIKDDDGMTSIRKTTTYGTDGVITHVTVFYPETDTTQEITYIHGRQDKVTEGGRTILSYTYTALQGGREETHIKDETADSGAIDKYYIDGQLIKIIDQNKVETLYEYNKDGKISKTSVSRATKQMESYTYSYDAQDHTIITDTAGVKKTYNQTNQILSMEKDNKVYVYYYSSGTGEVTNGDTGTIKASMDACMADLRNIAVTNGLLRGTDLTDVNGNSGEQFVYDPGDNFALEELTQYTDPNGNVIRYNNGDIDTITRPDGIEIKKVTVQDGIVTTYTIVLPPEKGGVTYDIKDNCVAARYNLDGSVDKFMSNEWLQSTTSADGVVTEYVYTLDPATAITEGTAGMEGMSQSITVTVDGVTRTYIYDTSYRLAKIIEGTTAYTYTAQGKIKSKIVSDADGTIRATVTYFYDDRLTSTLKEIVVAEAGKEYHYGPDMKLTEADDKENGVDKKYFYNGTIVSVKTTYTNKQSAAGDFADFTKENISVEDYNGMTAIRLDRTLDIDYGDGTDGVLEVKAGETKVLEAGTYAYSKITVEKGATLTVKAWNGSIGGQLILMCTGEAVIDGTIDLKGVGYCGSISEAKGNTYCGNGTCPPDTMGGGNGGRCNYPEQMGPSGGGGGAYANDGCMSAAGAYGGKQYGTDEDPCYRGSGGGAGGGTSGLAGGNGGNGGGIIRLIAKSVSINGAISTDGSDGGSVTSRDV
ncbi:MAG: hypothetical protein PHT32_04860, partial [Candidatus Omnitrophica bacterium]|nr:hypothetical protein [Candidatus Omnitrophota bacterium]